MKSNQKLALLFWHRKSKADKNGFAPVICRITIDDNSDPASIRNGGGRDSYQTAKANGDRTVKTLRENDGSDLDPIRKATFQRP